METERSPRKSSPSRLALTLTWWTETRTDSSTAPNSPRCGNRWVIVVVEAADVVDLELVDAELVDRAAAVVGRAAEVAQGVEAAVLAVEADHRLQIRNKK